MIELIVVPLDGSKQNLLDAINMEHNYPGIHQRVIWENIPNVSNLPLGKIISAFFLKRQYRRLVKSFKHKAENPNGECYIDSIAMELGISVSAEIQSSDGLYEPLIDFKYRGIEFRLYKKNGLGS